MKKNILNVIFVCSWLSNSIETSSHKLNNSILKNIDQAGFFDRAIFDIINIRQKIKNFLHGKHLWNGICLSLQTSCNQPLEILLKRADAIYGATFIVVPPTHPSLFKFVTSNHLAIVQHYVQAVQAETTLHRQEHGTHEGHFTGSYAIHPFTKVKLPIYVADYAIESFEIRQHYGRMAIPAHNSKDFEFAQKHHLEIKLVIIGHHNTPAHDQPQFTKDGKHLAQAYTKDDDETIVVHSESLNGNPKAAIEKVVTFITNNNIGKAYCQPVLYEFHEKKYSLESLKTIEEALLKEHLHLSPHQKETFAILMNYAQSDLLDIVEPFLNAIQTAKDLMIELIEESCTLRHTKNCYMLKWSQLKSSDSERTIFKRDIITFHELARFCSDLVNFLGDFASSCPHALENLKRLKRNT